MSEDNPFSSTTYDVFEKKYTTLLLDGKNKVLEYLKLEKSEYACFFVFNQKKELYQIYLTSSNTISEDEYKELCNYFKKAFDETNIDKEHNNAEFISNNTRCEINNYIVHSITIESKKFQPFIPEISKETISDALNGLNYHVSGFSMNLFELLDESVSNMKIGYSTVKAAKNTNDNTLTDIKEELKDKYPEYAATSYLITVHGGICQNPDLPYLKREDVDVIKLVLIFDDYGNLIEHMVLERCEDLNTYAILTMFG